jgi:hypothetical protein
VSVFDRAASILSALCTSALGSCMHTGAEMTDQQVIGAFVEGWLQTCTSVKLQGLPVSQVQQIHFWSICYAQYAHVSPHREATESHL